MDEKIRELERAAVNDPQARAALTVEYMRAKRGYCLFWVGDAKPCEGAVSSSATCEVPTDYPQELVARNHSFLSMPRDFYLLAIDDLADLESYLLLKPHGILNLETKKHKFFNTPFQLHRPRYGPGTRYPEVILGDGLYEIKAIPAGNYSSSSGLEKLVFFRYCPEAPPSGTPWPCADIVKSATKRTAWVLSTSTSFGEGGWKNVYIPYPKNYIILGISLLPVPGTDRDSFVELITKTQFRFHVGTRDYVRISSILVASMPGVGGSDLRSTISAPIAPILSLPEEINLIPHQNFFVELIPTEPFNLECPVELLLNFHGHYQRETM